MTESLLELKKKISSIQKTGQITEAMRMVSGVKLNRTEKLNQAYTVYNDHIRQTISHLVSAKIFDEFNKKNVEMCDDEINSLDYSD
ncbi:MAG: F0F1 ATP synthase subunit gamma, partial [Lactobacillus iners]|nr:F0F1 ATP synthase subunit gamma [Lactobacillus iners]